MDAARVLAMLLSLRANVSHQRLEDIASAIASAASTPREAAVLTAIEFEETSLRPLRYDFGLTCCFRRLEGHPLSDWAARSLAIWRTGYRRHNDEISGFFYYHSGRAIMNVHGHSRAFRREGRRAIEYARRCHAVVERVLRER